MAECTESNDLARQHRIRDAGRMLTDIDVGIGSHDTIGFRLCLDGKRDEKIDCSVLPSMVCHITKNSGDHTFSTVFSILAITHSRHKYVEKVESSQGNPYTMLRSLQCTFEHENQDAITHHRMICM